MTVDDFLRSADASAAAITCPDYTLGEKIYHAVFATQQAVGCNTNLGIILLCAPICQAALQKSPKQSVKQSLAQVLANTTQADAAWAFKAITMANPAGLGNADSQDVGASPTTNLTEAMAIAKNRDSIARQYATNYKDIFTTGVLGYNRGFACYGDCTWAAVVVFIGFLSEFPDSHIQRKHGNKYSSWILEQITTIADALADGCTTLQLVELLQHTDKLFKGRNINPGSTADLTVATVFIILISALS